MAKDNPKYNVYLGLNFDNFTKGAQEANRIGKKLDRMFKNMEKMQNNVEIGQKKLDRALRDGKITTEQHAKATALLSHEQQKYDEKVRKAEAATNKEAQAHLAAEKMAERHRRSLARLRKEKEQQRIAKGLGLITLAGSAASGLGMGGAAAGLARTGAGAGLMMGMGAKGMMAGAGMGLAIGGFAQLIGSATKQFMELERQVKGMQTLMGRGLGGRVVEEMRVLARETPLTTKGLIESSKIWTSYGQSTENITERMRRFGDIAGGNEEQMKLLTRAMAQVNATGKLMGQEKNQLINAGMNLEAIAKEAGVSMDEFADAMERGAISAEHVNAAVVTLTSEGGQFHGYMAEQAETLGGRLDMLKNSWNDMLATFGGVANNTGMFDFLIVPANAALGILTDIAKEVDRITEKNDKIIGEDGKEIKGTGLSRFHRFEGMEETKRGMFGSKDVYQDEKYTDQIRMMAENNRRYATATARRKYAAEEKAAAEAKAHADRVEEQKQKIKEAEEKRKRDIQRQADGGIAHAEFAASQEKSRLRQQGVAKYMQMGYSQQNALRAYEEDERHKAAQAKLTEGFGDGMGNIKDPAAKAEYDRQTKLAEQRHLEELKSIKNRQRMDNQLKKMQEEEKKIQETHKQNVDAERDAHKGRVDALKDRLSKGKSMMDRYLENRSADRGFKGGSVEEFKFISKMQQDSLKDRAEEMRLKNEEAMLTKLQEAHQKWLEAENSKLETAMTNLGTKMDNVESAIRLREL